MSLLKEKLSAFTVPQELKAKGVYPFFRPIASDQDTEVIIHGKKVLMFGSNSYLGLTNHPKVKEAAIAATVKYGTGCAGSPFLNGTLDIHNQLEKRLASLVGKQEAILYSTGFGVNLGTISCLTGREDYIIQDELDHASIIEGRRLSYSTTLKFKHNNMASLEKALSCIETDKVKLIVVDGVFSMEGDVAPLKEIVALAKKYDADVFVDEAHSLGVFGDHGRGICNSCGVTDDVALIMGTFSKSFAAMGGFIAGDAEVINFLRHNSRPYMFSASLTPGATAAVGAALDIMESEPERIARLWDLTHYALNGFKAMGCEVGHTCTPIIPLFIRDNEKTFRITTELLEQGIFVNPVISPAVASDNTLIRFSFMATHTKEQIDFAFDKLEKAFKKHGILKS
ncbi:MAG: pyridoxal phosphate-dependent aminotransferase family protein [Mucinivorans sp.]